MSNLFLRLELVGFNEGDQGNPIREFSFEPHFGSWVKVDLDFDLVQAVKLEGGVTFNPESKRYSVNAYVNGVQMLTALGFVVPSDNYVGFRVDGVGFLGFSIRGAANSE